MIRTAIVSIFLAAAACDVGELPNLTGDGGGGGGDGSGSDCEPISANIPSGHHNDGMACIVAGCHLPGNTGAGAPEWSYAGTVYKDPAGTMPYPGATIIITMGGMTQKIIAGDNGNFFISPDQLAAPDNAMTANTRGSACPTTRPMVGALTQGGGNCNNCHRPGADGPIDIP
jgi:hypothetical protein